NAANKAEGGGGGSPTPTSHTPGSCLLSCPSPFVVEPNSCSCVCGKTASSCFPNFVNADQCQCYSVDSGLVCLGTECPPGTFPDRTANCQSIQNIGPQGGGGSCDPTKDVVGDTVFGTQCP